MSFGTGESISPEDYPHEVPGEWSSVEIEGAHLIYENPELEAAVEVMQYEDEWMVYSNKPDGEDGQLMDLYESHSFDDLEDAFDQADEYMTDTSWV